jgi:hypothetical protein
MRTLYYNNFTTTAFDEPLVTVSGNGLVVQSGNVLHLTCPSGVDCTWSTTDEAPYVYAGGIGFLAGSEWAIATSGVAGSGVVTGGAGGILRGECRLTTVTSGVDDAPKSGLIFQENEDNVWQVSFNHDTEEVHLQKIVSNTLTTVASTSAIKSPNVSPVRFRIYVNSHPSRTILNDLNNAMSPGTLAAYYSDTDGTLWTQVGSDQSVSINYRAGDFGVFLKRSTASVVTDVLSEFDSFAVTVNDANALFWAPVAEDDETVVWEDTLTYWQNRFTDYTAASGMLDKKIGRLPDTDSNYQSKAAWEDYMTYAFDRLVYPSERNETENDFGGQGAWEDNLSLERFTQVNPGLLAETSSNFQGKMAWEDAMSITFDPSADWEDGTLDGEGRELIQGYNIQAMYYYDSTDEPWRLHGPGFYGAAADGYHYYNGTPTELYEPIATSASGVNQLSWGDYTNPLCGIWPSHSSYYNVTYPTTSGEMRLDTTSPLTDWQSAGVFSAGRWTLYGDFDIEVRYKNTTKSGGNGGGLNFEIVRDEWHRVYLEFEHDGNIATSFQNEGSWQTKWKEYDNDASGRLRFIRTGSNIQAYRYQGGWNAVGGAQAFGGWNANVRLRVTGTGNLSWDTVVYDLRLNSGTVDRTCGWAREGAGDHFGTKKDFPERAYIIASNNSLNIIDADTELLWMRFVGASNNAYHNSSDQGIRSVKMKDGVLWAAMSGSGTSGHAVRIDFTKEDCRYIAPSDSLSFARYKFQSGGYRVGYHGSIGGIRDRNGANGFNGNWTPWKLPGGNCFGVDFMFEGVGNWNERVAIATNGGIALRNYDRHTWNESGGADYPNVTETLDTTPCYWCYFDEDTGGLYWTDSDNVHYAAKATYVAGYGGTFSADTTKELPGQMGAPEQYSMVGSSGYLYITSAGNVYRISDLTGEWQLAVGKPGSGAVSESLSTECDYVSSIGLSGDAGISLIMVCTENERYGWTQVVFLRADTLALYAKSELIAGKTGQPKVLLG